MPTDPPSAIDRLSPSWIRRSISPRPKTAQEADPRPAAPNGFLQPRSTSGSSNSDDSRSSKSGRRGSVREMVSRLRSPSNASIASNQSQDPELDEVDNWFYGFRKYNQLVSTEVSANHAHPSQDFSKASRALTKKLWRPIPSRLTRSSIRLLDALVPG